MIALCTFQKTAASLIDEDGSPWDDHEVGDHLSATRQAEVWVFIGTDIERAELWEATAMYFDKRKKGKGLTVGRHANALNHHSATLEPGDRLLPQTGLEDVGDYAVVGTPCWLRFWRPSRATLTTSPNPLWEQGPGISIVGNFAVDFLHTVALGVMGSVVCQVIWRVLLSDIFVPQGLEKNMRFAIGIGRLNAELNTWYESERNAGRAPNEVEALAPSMFGTPETHAIKAKGGETMDLFRWCTMMLLPSYAARIRRGVQLKTCADALLAWTDDLARQPDCISLEACERLKNLARQHLIGVRAAGIQIKPKHHLFWHMNTRTRHLLLICHPPPHSSSTSSSLLLPPSSSLAIRRRRG